MEVMMAGRKMEIQMGMAGYVCVHLISDGVKDDMYV
jgi:hypothetical protein